MLVIQLVSATRVSSPVIVSILFHLDLKDVNKIIGRLSIMSLIGCKVNVHQGKETKSVPFSPFLTVRELSQEVGKAKGTQCFSGIYVYYGWCLC